MTQELISNLVEKIKDEVLDFYEVEVEDQVVEDFVGWYYMDRGNEGFEPFDEDGNPIFDTTEREDFMLYLEELGN
jgi:hypothetical protein